MELMFYREETDWRGRKHRLPVRFARKCCVLSEKNGKAEGARPGPEYEQRGRVNEAQWA